MPCPAMSRSRAAAVLLALLLAAAGPLAAQAPQKKVLTHADYEIWNTATGMTLSRDGQYVAYTFTPPEGDAAVVIRHVPTGKEHRIARGGRPAGAPDDESPAGAGGFASRLGGAVGSPVFSPDVKRVIVPLTPTKAEVEKAKADKDKKETPQPYLGIVDLTTGQVTARIPRTRGFVVGGTGAGILLYHKQPAGGDAPADAPAGGGTKGGGFTKGGFKGKQTTPGGTAPTRPTRVVGTDLVIRDLATGKERTLPDVGEYSLTRDGKVLVYTVVGKKDGEGGGVFAVEPASTAGPVAIRTGPGRYSRLTWDEKQTKLAFLHDDAGATTAAKTAPMPRPVGGTGGTATATTTPAPPPPPSKWRVYVWERASMASPAPVGRLPVGSPMGLTAIVSAAFTVGGPTVAPAGEILGPDSPGLKKGWGITGDALSFSPDGTRVYVSTGPERPPAPGPTGPAGAAAAGGPGRAAAAATADAVNLDIWHWKDGHIQPMQRVRGTSGTPRSFSAVVFLDGKLFRQLSDESLSVGSPEGDWAVGSDDKKYLHLTGYGPSLRDYTLMNVRTGERKPILTGFGGLTALSPTGKHLLTFDGKDWVAHSVPDGKKTNLTAGMAVKFFNEDFDSPSEPPAYGLTGWTPDGKHVLLNDRYDIWKVAVDGSGAENVTKTGRTQQIRFRRLPIDVSGEEDATAAERRGVDLSKPMLLAAENLHTRDTGFFRLEPGGTPKLMVMGARRYGPPAKARNADVFLLTVSSFNLYPDYYTTGPDFHELKRVTDINPKVREFNWGKAELVHYRSADGVPLSGVLIKPENFDPSKKYPMVVYIYERLSDTLHNFRLPAAGTSINPTFYASNGYLVFMPDIAYKVGSPGQSALKCVLPAISAVCEKGFVDEAAIGIQGHSWGGYQIAYLITQTNRFKAAAAGAPVSNMVSAYGGIRWGTGLPRQFQYERTQSRIGGTLWEHPMRFIENSPIFMADRVQTPLLMLHNDQDDAVPWYQGIEYFLALRRLGKEVYLLNYNGELHGLRRKATQRDYTLRMFHFFEHHLKGKPAPGWMEKGVPYADREKEKEQWKKLFQSAEKK